MILFQTSIDFLSQEMYIEISNTRHNAYSFLKLFFFLTYVIKNNKNYSLSLSASVANSCVINRVSSHKNFNITNSIQSINMQIIDLNEKYESLYCVCLEDWSDEMKEAGNHKSVWYNKMKDKGLQVKLALDDKGKVGGMIQYLPIEHSFVIGKDLFFILCIWVHGYKKGRGNFQKKGMGKALIRAAEDDAKSKGAKGIAAWGLSLPFWMKASWFKKQGYKKVDKQGIQTLLWKPFAGDVDAPEWIKQKKKPDLIPGKVTVTAFINGWCPAQNIVFERAKRAALEFKDNVVFRGINTFDKDVFLEWGITDALFVDDKEIRTGPPPSYNKIKKIIAGKEKNI